MSAIDGLSWAALTGEWLDWLRLGGRSDETIGLRRYQAGRLARAFPEGPAAVSAAGLASWLAGMRWSAETRRSYCAAARQFFSWAASAGRLAVDPAAGLPAGRSPSRLPRPAPVEAAAAGLGCGDGRVRLMVALAFRQGLRRGEIARVHTRDVAAGRGGWSLVVRGKGGRERRIPLWPDIAAELRSLPEGFVFPGQVGGHLSPAYVGKLVSRALPPGWAAHSLRHAFATGLYDRSRDLLAVQRFLGHVKPETTQGYVMVAEDWLRAALAADQP
ncbi:MAG: tyrosine-type recombinase/integrase [Propionibacteriaceae bacterium]|jgi:integrase|nr:tyrosine-type recombinase/integrase [Propionibacteriaceae bacterium]